MRKPRLHKRTFTSVQCQKGMALLVLFSLILIAVTAVAVSHLSLNSQSINRTKNTTMALSYSKNILLGHALGQPIPGTLPCPDSNNDGLSDPTGCTNRRGLLPYKTLNISQQLDGTGQPLWYAIDMRYAGAITPPHNSSRLANLTLDGQSMVFIVIAPNSPFSNQNPVSQPLANITQFLEGDNADNTLNSYSSLKDDTHNDLLLGVSALDFWMVVEKRVLDDAKTLMENYRTNCPSPIPWPWAAPFNTGVSLAGTYEGALPLVTALPIDWQTGCAASVDPGYLRAHWDGILYYAICDDVLPVNPPTTSCLTLGSKTAKVVILSPGAPVGAQIRGTLINQFFENNDNSQNDNQFDLLVPGAADNDLFIIIEQ